MSRVYMNHERLFWNANFAIYMLCDRARVVVDCVGMYTMFVAFGDVTALCLCATKHMSVDR